MLEFPELDHLASLRLGALWLVYSYFYNFLTPKYLLFYSTIFWIPLFKILCASEIMQHQSYCVWLFHYDRQCSSTLLDYMDSLLWLNKIHIWSIFCHWYWVSHLNNVARNTEIHICHIAFYLAVWPEMEWLEHMSTVFSIFEESADCFRRQLQQLHSITPSLRIPFPFLSILLLLSLPFFGTADILIVY